MWGGCSMTVWRRRPSPSASGLQAISSRVTQATHPHRSRVQLPPCRPQPCWPWWGPPMWPWPCGACWPPWPGRRRKVLHPFRHWTSPRAMVRTWNGGRGGGGGADGGLGQLVQGRQGPSTAARAWHTPRCAPRARGRRCPPRRGQGGAAPSSTLTKRPHQSLSTSNQPPLPAELKDDWQGPRHRPPVRPPTGVIHNYDPATLQSLGTTPAMTPAEVRDRIAAARAASAVWRSSTFAQRRRLMRVLLKFVVDHQDVICRRATGVSGWSSEGWAGAWR